MKRRHLLEAAAVSGIAWTRPVVESVVLPAHATASCNVSGCFQYNNGQPIELIDGTIFIYNQGTDCSESNLSDTGLYFLSEAEALSQCNSGVFHTLSSSSNYDGICEVYACGRGPR